MIKPHIPLIRFRKGHPPMDEGILSHLKQHFHKPDQKETNVQEPELLVASSLAGKQWRSVPVLHEWWDTPTKFKRRELDPMECDIINVSCFPFSILKNDTLLNNIQYVAMPCYSLLMNFYYFSERRL